MQLLNLDMLAVVTCVNTAVAYGVTSAITAAARSFGISDPTNANVCPIAWKYVNPLFSYV